MPDAFVKLCIERSLKTQHWVSSQLNVHGQLIGFEDDLVCYYKLPYFLTITGDRIQANQLLDYMKATFFKAGNSITFNNRKTNNPLIAHFWSYVIGWIALASHRLGRYDISYPAYDYLSQFQSQDHGGFSPTNPWGTNEDLMDVISTSQLGRFALQFGKKSEAVKAGDFLVWNIKHQPSPETCLYLVVNNLKQPLTHFAEGGEWLGVIYTDKPNQAYFMIGLACAFLLELYNATNNEIYLMAAKQYGDFALECDPSIKTFTLSHKVAWAMSLLYRYTLDEKYLVMCKTIAEYLISTQDSDGQWLRDQDPITSLDQSVEIAIWLQEIASNLANR